VIGEVLLREEGSKRGSVECEEEGAQDRALGDTTLENSWFRKVTTYRDHLSAVVKIRFEPLQRCSSDTKPVFKPMKKHSMVNSVESSREVKKNESSDFARVHSCNNIIVNGKKSSFSRVELTIGRLKRKIERVERKVLIYTFSNDTLNELRNKVKVRDWSEVSQVFNVERWLFQQRMDYGPCKRRRERSFRQ
jgi:hypothetical protein